MGRPGLLACVLLGLGLIPAPPVRAEAPARVVSINLCTDQLAMLLAAPGQLVSVSYLARDPHSSSMAAEAAAYPVNRGQVEQIYLMRPDVVLTGTWDAPASLALMRGLGLNVVQVPPVQSLVDVPSNIRAVAAALGRDAAGEALLAEYQAGLKALPPPPGPPVPAALYYPNGYTSGAGTLADDLLAHAGFRNIATDLGLSGGGTLPLERLLIAAPRLLVTAAPFAGASRAEEVTAHPALARLRARGMVQVQSDADWVCGTPHLLRALRKLAQARAELDGGAP